MLIQRKLSLVKYWLRIASDWDAPALVKDACILTMNNSLHWVNLIKQILDDTGFSYAWFQPANVDHTRFIAELEQCLTDQYKQNWESELQATTGKLRTYKQHFRMEMYLDLPPHLRVPVAKLRTSSHSLRIETGRYDLPAALPPDKQYCWFCDDDSIEDELFKCKLYTSLQELLELTTHCCLLNAAFIHLSDLDKRRFIFLM